MSGSAVVSSTTLAEDIVLTTNIRGNNVFD